LKLVAKEAPGQRELSDPAVQQSIRDNISQPQGTVASRGYLAIARNDAKVTNYLAQQIVESAGKLPVVVTPKDATSSPAPPGQLNPDPPGSRNTQIVRHWEALPYVP